MTQLGETCRYKLTVTDEDDTPVDADEIVITLYDPSEVSTDLSGNEVKDSTGIYYLDHTFTIAGSEGEYRFVVKTTKAGKSKIDVLREQLESA